MDGDINMGGVPALRKAVIAVVKFVWMLTGFCDHAEERMLCSQGKNGTDV